MLPKDVRLGLIFLFLIDNITDDFHLPHFALSTLPLFVIKKKKVTVCWSPEAKVLLVVISLLQKPEKGRQPVCIR